MKRGHERALAAHGPETFVDSVPDAMCAAMRLLRGPNSGPAELQVEEFFAASSTGRTQHCIRVSAWDYCAMLTAEHMRALSATLCHQFNARGMRISVYAGMSKANASRRHIGALVAEATWDTDDTLGATAETDDSRPKRQRGDTDDGDGDGGEQSALRRIVGIVTGI